MIIDNSWRNAALCEPLPRSDIAQVKGVAGTTKSAASTKRKYVRKSNNFPENMH